MKKPFASILWAAPLALLLTAGSVHAQFKAPDNSRPRDPLGSGGGLGLSLPSGSAPLAPSNAAPVPAPPADASPSSGEAVVQEIANCVMAGLPPDWTMAQVDVREIARKDKNREFEAIYSYLDGEGKAGPFTPCDQKEPALNVYKLNGALDPDKRNWIRATLVFSKEGKFELQYDYAPAKDGDKGAAPAAAAKKDAKKAPARKN